MWPGWSIVLPLQPKTLNAIAFRVLHQHRKLSFNIGTCHIESPHCSMESAIPSLLILRIADFVFPWTTKWWVRSQTMSETFFDVLRSRRFSATGRFVEENVYFLSIFLKSNVWCYTVWDVGMVKLVFHLPLWLRILYKRILLNKNKTTKPADWQNTIDPMPNRIDKESISDLILLQDILMVCFIWKNWEDFLHIHS